MFILTFLLADYDISMACGSVGHCLLFLFHAAMWSVLPLCLVIFVWMQDCVLVQLWKSDDGLFLPGCFTLSPLRWRKWGRPPYPTEVVLNQGCAKASGSLWFAAASPGFWSLSLAFSKLYAWALEADYKLHSALVFILVISLPPCAAPETGRCPEGVDDHMLEASPVACTSGAKRCCMSPASRSAWLHVFDCLVCHLSKPVSKTFTEHTQRCSFPL